MLAANSEEPSMDAEEPLKSTFLKYRGRTLSTIVAKLLLLIGTMQIHSVFPQQLNDVLGKLLPNRAIFHLVLAGNIFLLDNT